MDKLLKALYVAGTIGQIVIRAPIERQRRHIRMTDERVDRMERVSLGVLFLWGFLIPMAYVFTPWLNRANYRWSPETKARAGGLGALLMAGALWLFWRSHADLGHNWSPSLQIGAEHTLVTRGVYRYIRHPMYASQWVWIIAQLLLLQNWIAGSSGLLSFPLLYLGRVSREEQMMLDHFGDTYRAYMGRTGRVLPRLRQTHAD